MAVDYKHADLFLQSYINKSIEIKTEDGNTTITDSDFHLGTLELDESICSESQLVFGSCETCSVGFKISNVFSALDGKWLIVKQTLEGGEDEPFTYGRYKVFSDVPTADRSHRQVTAYDAMYDILIADVVAWYDALLPDMETEITLKQFRDSFFEFLGIEQENVTLANDGITVNRTIQTSELKGQDVVTAICEINGCFGHIGRNGKFQYIFLEKETQGLYPRDDLFPAATLYPREQKSTKIGNGMYISCDYEDVVTEPISKLQIRQEENDIGAIVGTGTNCYVVQNNFLVYGKSADELNEIAQNLFNVIHGISYRPIKSLDAVGNPCLEVGDPIYAITKYEIVETYILQRTLRGSQALRDKYVAKGKKIFTENNDVNRSINQLRGKTNVLERTVEETNSRITDVQSGLQSQIAQTAEQITASVSQTYETKTDATGKLNEAKSDATNKANQALSDANNATDAKLQSYSTTTEMNSAISLSAQGIKQEVSNTYATQSSLTTAVNNLQDQIDDNIETFTGSAVPTLNNAPANIWTTTTDKDKHIGDLYVVNAQGGDYAGFYYRFEKNGSAYQWTLLKDTEITKALADAAAAMAKAEGVESDLEANYSTTTQMNSAISQSASSITSSVSATYETKIDATTKLNSAKTYADTQANNAESNANTATDNKLLNYSTTTQMNSAISQSASEIKTEVSNIYETRTNANSEYSNLSSRITQNANAISTKVENDTVSSHLQQEADGFKISGNRIEIDSTYFKLAADGTINATNGNFTGNLTSGSTNGSKVEISGGAIVFKYSDVKRGEIIAETLQLTIKAPNSGIGTIKLDGLNVDIGGASYSTIKLSAIDLQINGRSTISGTITYAKADTSSTTVVTNVPTTTVKVVTGITQVGSSIIPTTADITVIGIGGISTKSLRGVSGTGSFGYNYGLITSTL